MKYAEYYANEYLGKIFYYCLRKTGNEDEAKELSSEISFEVLQGLSRGMIPEHFSAWVWQIVRNRYARWAEKKSRRRSLFSDEDIFEYTEIADGAKNAEELLVEKEEIAILKRELAHIHSDYRQILVAFYIDDKKVSKIAEELSLPLGTIKTRLVKARKILKEGMDMAREFGKLSYRPEEISFMYNVPKPGRNGNPWSLFCRLLPKNILLALYRNPMTAEELSFEVGVALPYLEEEITVLERELLLRKNGREYETTIYIMSAEAQRRLYDKLSAVAPALTDKIMEYLTLRDALYEKSGFRWNLGAQSDEDMRWARLMRAVDVADFYVHSDEKKSTSRPDGGEWDIVGYEEYSGPEFTPVGQHGAYGSKALFSQYKFRYQNIYSKTPEHLKPALADALEEIAEGREADADAVCELLDMGYLKEENGVYIPQMMVVDNRYGDIGGKGLPAADAETLDVVWKEVVALVREVCAYRLKMIEEEAPACLKGSKGLKTVIESCGELRGAVLDTALAKGYISYAEKDPRILLGTMLTVGNKE